MHSSSRFIKLSGIALLISLFIIGSFHSASVEAIPAAQATMNGTLGPMASCPTLDSSAMMSETPQSTMSAATLSASGDVQTGYLGVELGAVDNCGVQVRQVFNGSSAANVLQPNDVIVAVDCVALSDMIGGHVATASPDNGTMTNCMNANPPMGTMTGVVGAMSNPACMNTGIVGGTLNVMKLFLCVIGQYHAGDSVTLTIWRGDAQKNVSIAIDSVPPSLVVTTTP